MSTTVLERTVKRRRGYYRMTDIHASCLTYNDGSPYYTDFVAYFTLDQYERVTISATKKFMAYSTRACQIINDREVDISRNFTQETTVQFVPNPTISISNDLGVIGDACSINYRISDSDSSVRFKIIEKINGVKIAEKSNVVDGNYELIITDELLSELAFNSVNNITIELDNGYGGIFLDKTVTFTKGNTKPKLNISSYNSTSATFTAIDTDDNLSKIEWFIDDVLKETITTDLTTEKTINYELTDNAIHTLKIVATDAENATVEKVLSISKEIMPLQSDATLQDISTKLAEIGEGFRNGKTSIINTLALKNIEASLNNTLVELSEKIKTSFDSSDASVQELQNRITELTNQLSQRKKWASGTDTIIDPSALRFNHQVDFEPNLIIFFIGQHNSSNIDTAIYYKNATWSQSDPSCGSFFKIINGETVHFRVKINMMFNNSFDVYVIKDDHPEITGATTWVKWFVFE
ncbi:hypothetical protein NQ701_11495 [Clostridioides difficile]|nr:hypothetical protein [Clostridioides difficile]